MKKLWFALCVALAIPACMDGPAAPPATEAQASELASPAPADLTCRQACAESYEACLGAATDQSAECNCYNSDVACRRRCGDHDPFIQCP